MANTEKRKRNDARNNEHHVSRRPHSAILDGALDVTSLSQIEFTLGKGDCRPTSKPAFTTLKRSASIAVLNAPGEVPFYEVSEEKFHGKLQESSKEMRLILWNAHERKKKSAIEEEMMKCCKQEKAAYRSVVETMRSVQDELGKTTSLTVLQSRLAEAKSNNQELKKSIFHNMSDRSLLRLATQPDLPLLFWQIASIKSQVTVLQERLRYLSGKFQNMSTPPNTSCSSSQTLIDVDVPTWSSQSSLSQKKSSKGWNFMSRLFPSKKSKENIP